MQRLLKQVRFSKSMWLSNFGNQTKCNQESKDNLYRPKNLCTESQNPKRKKKHTHTLYKIGANSTSAVNR